MQICDLVKLRYDVSCIQEHLLNGCQGLTIPMIVDFSARKALYKEQFKAGENCADYAEFKEKLCLLRDSKLPFRGIDGVKRVMKAQNNCALLLSLNIPELYDKLKRQEFFTEFEKKLISQIPGLEENLVFVEKILWLHGTNSATLTLLPYTGYEMIPTGRLLDRGIAPMSGEISQNGMTRGGINQGKLSVDTISGIKRCSEYAKITSRSFNSFFYTDQEETIFLSRLRELEKLSTDDAKWDPTLIELIRLKQWSPEAFENLVKKYEAEIEALKKAIVEKKCLYECLILKALELDTNMLIQAKNDSELRQKVESEFPARCFNHWEGDKWYDYVNMARVIQFFLEPNSGHTFQVCLSRLPYNSQYQLVIYNLFKMKANGDEWLKQFIAQLQDETRPQWIRDDETDEMEAPH